MVTLDDGPHGGLGEGRLGGGGLVLGEDGAGAGELGLGGLGALDDEGGVEAGVEGLEVALDPGLGLIGGSAGLGDGGGSVSATVRASEVRMASTVVSRRSGSRTADSHPSRAARTRRSVTARERGWASSAGYSER